MLVEAIWISGMASGINFDESNEYDQYVPRDLTILENRNSLDGKILRALTARALYTFFKCSKNMPKGGPQGTIWAT